MLVVMTCRSSLRPPCCFQEANKSLQACVLHTTNTHVICALASQQRYDIWLRDLQYAHIGAQANRSDVAFVPPPRNKASCQAQKPGAVMRSCIDTNDALCSRIMHSQDLIKLRRQTCECTGCASGMAAAAHWHLTRCYKCPHCSKQPQQKHLAIVHMSKHDQKRTKCAMYTLKFCGHL